MSKLHAKHYADRMNQVHSTIEHNELVGEHTYRLRIAAPTIASSVLPGQFVMIRLAGRNAPLIGRALAVYDVVRDPSGTPTWIDLVYLRKGVMTRSLAASPLGTAVSVWGPLGNGFRNTPCDRLIMAVGGIGQTPMLTLGREALARQSFGDPVRSSGWSPHVELIYGARRKSLLAGVDDFRAAGFQVTLCTDDGSEGLKQLVPEVLAARLNQLPPGEQIRVATCGPEIMMEKVAEVCENAGPTVSCDVSMETPMACGIGICFSCVAKIRQQGPEPWDYKRTCVEGPIFDAKDICW
ncbi:dihydroorotate dehydrogenase electron transfer subunit [Novipirellula artificiosorum]|uniref:Dihydroorotate dehydrogenase B (NAD(+)), electron transfer subunit n=1 Tax=Novipirellula artificiosorum TaxID=2528016 RepID=A0A5C6D2V1_9BACT|nr:dihydroorotate dehydrogenase electron transfer subunit [Novipirellula artificiosorum]TWU31513.1 Dihydroorotate dehydrogenase B (NAD(+)), electron transfer subunit [Novipirellula artificiosorum]